MKSYRVYDKASRSTVVLDISTLDLNKPWVVTIKRYKRSLNQNALFHKWVDQIACHTGHTNEETKDQLKFMFLPPTSITEFKGVITEHRHTSMLDKAEMGLFMDRVSAFAHSDLRVRLTVPEEMHEK